MKALKALLLASATFALIALGALFLELRSDVHQLDGALLSSTAKLDATIANVDGMVGHLDEAAKQSAQVSRDTRINLVHLDRNQQKLARDIEAAIVRVNLAVMHTDMALNGPHGVLPEAAGTIRRAGDDADTLTIAAVPVIEHTDDLVNSPAVKQALSSTASTADYTRDSMKEVRDAIHELRNPPKKTRGRRIADFILQYIIGNAIKGAAQR